MTYCKGNDCKGKKKQAKFNYTGMRPEYCGKCKLPNMVCVVNKKCITCNDKQPVFNLPTESKGLYCSDCSLPNMINVVGKKCIKCDLKKPTFNYPTETNALYCGKCKLPNMVDVLNPKCITCNKKRANFNLPNKTNALYCGKCKSPEMINVKSKKCIVCKDKIPNFNFPTESKGLYCSDCSLPNMINVVSKKCLKCNSKQPNFNLPTESKGLYCGKCKSPEMIDVVHPKCITNLCEQFSTKNNYCIRCYYYHNPDKKPKRLKVKEEEVVNYLKQELKDIELITDKALIGDGICLKNRPDVLIHLNNYSIIVEIDENQHKFYNPICDEARINNIQEALNRPIVIIRFNPDSYSENGKKIKSCFKNDEKTGLKTIPKNKEEDWNNRLAKLKETIINELDDCTDEPIRIIKLFYDIKK